MSENTSITSITDYSELCLIIDRSERKLYDAASKQRKDVAIAMAKEIQAAATQMLIVFGETPQASFTDAETLRRIADICQQQLNAAAPAQLTGWSAGLENLSSLDSLEVEDIVTKKGHVCDYQGDGIWRIDGKSMDIRDVYSLLASR